MPPVLDDWARQEATNLDSVFEASHTDRVSASPEKVWALWSNPAKWTGWNEQLASVAAETPLEAGTLAQLKLKRGGRMTFQIIDLEPNRRLLSEAKLVGCRYGHEQTIAPSGKRSSVTHRLYLVGPLSGFFATMFGRKRMREWVEGYVARERELAG